MSSPRFDAASLTVLFEDDALLAVDKPSGVLVHRGWGNDRVVLVDVVRAYLGVDSVYPLHRLDRQTSGVVVFAKRAEVAARLGAAFDGGLIEKCYFALVRGIPPADGEIDHPIPRREGGPRVPALTRFSRVASAELPVRAVSTVLAFPKTGRLHQVRRHLKHISHPVIGDANYGKGVLNRAIRDQYGLDRMALHAKSISLIHPLSGVSLEIIAPLPSSLSSPLGRMGFDVVEGR